MPRPHHLWRHCIINTLNTWLHGDERGFRSRNPEIRSSGDYKNPPPPGEYRKLNEYFEEHAGNEVHIPRELRSIIGRAILDYVRLIEMPTLAIAVGKVHTHFVTEMPEHRGPVKRLVGHAKRRSSLAIRQWLPGKVWAAGGEFVICKDKSHVTNAVDYVLYDQGPAAWTWSFRDADDEGCFGRKRPH